EVQKGRRNFGGQGRQLVFALEAVGSAEVVKPLLDLVKAGRVPADREESVLALIGRLGGPKEMALIFTMVVARDATPAARRLTLLAALARAHQQRGVLPEGDLGRVGTLLSSENEALRATAARMVGQWKVESLAGKLQELAQDKKTSKPLRQAAF